MLENMTVPKHVAVILDGNGRWAKKHGVPRAMGHKAGCETLEKMVRIAADMGISYFTVYGFSTENWKRSAEEVGALMKLFRYYMVRLLKIANENNVRVKMIGDKIPVRTGYHRRNRQSDRRNEEQHGYDVCHRYQLRWQG